MLPTNCYVVAGSKSDCVAPEREISRPAALLALPTRALASLNEYESMGPEGGTPTCQ